MASSTTANTRPVPARSRPRRKTSAGPSPKVKQATPGQSAAALTQGAADTATAAAAGPAVTRPGFAHDQPSTTVGVRELRQNLSIYLDRVKQGAALQVTEHGRVVAVLRPVPPNASRYDILLAQGLITPATKSIRDLPPPRKMPPGSRPMSEILDEMRSEERY